MRRIYSFLIIILMVSALPVFAQKGTRIKSKIVSTDNTPLQGAIVSVVGTSSSVVSDENGAFELTTDLSKQARLMPLIYRGMDDLARRAQQMKNTEYGAYLAAIPEDMKNGFF